MCTIPTDASSAELKGRQNKRYRQNHIVRKKQFRHSRLKFANIRLVEMVRSKQFTILPFVLLEDTWLLLVVGLQELNANIPAVYVESAHGSHVERSVT